MRCLVVGAGVIGSLYAHLLAKAGEDVSVYARGARLAELRRDGLLVRTSQGVETSGVTLVDALPEDGYDVVLVAVRFEQAEPAIGALAHTRHPMIVTMVNTPDVRAWDQVLGPGRLLPAFPGAGGTLVDGGVGGGLTSPRLPPTMVGGLDGRATPRLGALVASFKAAGIPVRTSARMPDWLRSHVALIVPLGMAAAAGDLRDRGGPRPCAQGLPAGFRAGGRSGARIEPARYRIFRVLPPVLVAPVLGRVLTSRFAAQFVVPHARRAQDEIAALAAAFARLTPADAGA